MTTHRTIIAALCAIVVLHAGCDGASSAVEDRFMECRDLAHNKETQTQSLTCFTPRSRAILEGLLEQRRASGGVLGYMRAYSRLLDYDEIAMPADIENGIALLVVAKGRKRQTILMEYDADNDQWLIDALELSGFWRPLDDAMEL